MINLMLDSTISYFVLANLSAVLNTVLLLVGGYVFFKGMQQRGYHNQGYLIWIYKGNNKFFLRLINVCVFSAMSYLLFCFLFSVFEAELFSFLGLIFYFIFTMIFFTSSRKYAKEMRQTISYTGRMKRLYLTTGILVFLLTILGFVLIHFFQLLNFTLIKYTRYIIFCFFPLLLPILVKWANTINLPNEKRIINKFKGKAKEKLKNFPNLKIVGITGSYGKTTVKNILQTILSEKFKVVASPMSYNTPQGLSKTINELISKETEVFIAEMGARRVGDIKELTNFIPLDFAVVTAVGKQHLESFKKIENIAKTKFEIVEGLKSYGKAFFNGNDDGAKSLFDKTLKNKLISGFSSNCDLFSNDLKISDEGSKFTIETKGEKILVSSRLLGKHNISNLLLASMIALEMGLTLNEIKSAIEKIQPVPHRLEIVRQDDVTVIDDSYNANIQGVKYALEVLALFEGRKIVITPGLIELGKMEELENVEMGRRLAKVADKVILVGTKRSIPLASGMIEQNFPKENILVCENLEEATKIYSEISRPCDVVLFENDLPDSYL